MPIRRTIATLLFLAAPLPAQVAADSNPKLAERYKQMLAADPREGTALDRLWKLAQDQGQTPQLLAEYQATGTFASELILGHLLRKAGRLDEAQAAYERAAKLDEKNVAPLLALGRMQAEAGKSREAVTWLERARTVLPPQDPQLPDALLQLGTAWLALGDLTKAAEAWEAIVALNPSNLELRHRLAENYAQNHLTDRAIGHLQYLAEHSPPAERALAWQQIARLYQGAGKQDAAIAAIDKALALTAPGNWLRAELQSQLIRLYQRYHRTAELEERWNKSVLDNPRDLGSYLQLIDLYARLGDHERERLWLEKLTQLAPKNPDYRLRLARLLVQMDQLDPAAAGYDALLKEQPANADFVFERARLDVQRNALDDARQRIVRLLALRPGDETIRAKAVEFYEQNQLTEPLEQQLIAEAATGGEEAISALANFYFAHRREPEAEQTLGRLVVPREPPEKQAAAHFQIAQILKTQGRLPAATAALERAVKLQPETRDFQLLLGELLKTRGENVAAQTALEKAVALSKTPAEEGEADQQLFECVRSSVSEPVAVPRPRLGLSLGADPGTAQGNAALDAYLRRLTQAAAKQPSEAAWLRVARWFSWNRALGPAREAAQKALTINPKSVAACELLIKLNTTEGPSPGAIALLTRLGEIDPANRASYQRRAGQLELQGGRLDQALSIGEALVKASPGNLEALTDLALTQQRADRWKDALETWRQIYALSPGTKKRDAFTPLLQALERLELHSQAAELQLKAIDTEADERQRFALFDDLLAYATKHPLLDWLREQFERRRQLRADDYFTEVALGRILKARGNQAAAFEVLADASYAAPNQAEALPELVREAVELRKLDAAVKLQDQLLRIVPQTRPEGFLKLADLQEKNFDIDAATRTWSRLVVRFPRDATVLEQAVEFQLKWGTPAAAAELLRRSRTLAPTNPQPLVRLAEIDLTNGQSAEAEACLEQILRIVPLEATGEAIRYPALKPEDAGRLQIAYLTTVRQRKGKPSPDALRALSSFWVEEAAEATGGDRELRLNAIRQLAQITRDKDNPAALTAWIERWKKNAAAPSEMLWALYYAGAGPALLDGLDGLLQKAPEDDKMPQAYIWLALQTGQFTRLSTWLQNPARAANERDYLLIALGQYLTVNQGRIDPGLLAGLFPESSNQRLWQTALLLATRGHFPEAAQLGQRVFDRASTQRAAYGRELAHWYLYLGQPEQARTVLRGAIATAAESFDAEVYAALREYYLLLPAGERATFSASYLGGIDAAKQPLHAVFATTLLRALAGDETAAKAQLEGLIGLRALAAPPADEVGKAAARRWQLLLTAGAQLQTWHLEKLTVFLWEKALADPALIQLQGEEGAEPTREIRQRLYALRAARAEGPELQDWIEEYARASTREGALPLGEALEGLGASSRAVEVFRQLWERNPADPQALRNLLVACRTANDNDTAETALWKMTNELPSRISDPGQRDLLVQLADLLDRRGDTERARTVLSGAVENSGGDSRVLLRLGQLHEKAGHPDSAEMVYRRLLSVEPGNTVTRLALATLLETQGRLEAALALLQQGEGPDLAARRAQLQLKAGQVDAALATLEKIPPPQHVAPTVAVAEELVKRGDRRLARSVLQAAIERTKDVGMSFPLLCKSIEALTPQDGAPAIQREFRRLRQVSTQQPSLLASTLDFAQREAPRLGLAKEFSAELSGIWAEGSGPIAAGAVLLANQLTAADHAAADATLPQLLARDDLGEVWLQRIAGHLDQAHRPALALQIRERLTQVNPANEGYRFDWATALQQAGRTEEARAVLETLALRTVFNEELAGKLAKAFGEIGQRGRARQLFTEALRNDPGARNFPAWLDFAALQIAEQDFSAARRTLRTAFGNPANRSFSAIIDWLAAAGKLEQADPELADFSLSPGRLAILRRTLFERLAREAKFTPALALLDAHPEIANPAVWTTLGELAKSGQQFEPVAALLEKLLKQTPSAVDLALPLAQLYLAWATADLTASTPGPPEPTLAHLRRAHQLRPDFFEIAQKLCTLQSQTGATKAALETLESYLALATNPVEIEKAQALLAKVKAGTKL